MTGSDFSDESLTTKPIESVPDEEVQQLSRFKTHEDDDEEAAISREISRVRTNDDNLSKVLSGKAHTFTGPLPEMGNGKPYPPALPEDRQPYRVEFDGPNDPTSPLNWPMKRKVPIAGALAFVTANVAFGSAIYGSAVPEIEKVFHVGTTPAELGVSLYVLGFATGPCVWGPMSEYLGRRVPLVLSCFLLVCFSFATATAKDFQTLIICRFFAGVTGSAPLSVVPGVFADMFDSQTRGSAAAIFAMCVSGGPMLAPVMGSFIALSYLGWRWCLYIGGIMSAVSLVLVVFFYEETYHPVILAKKAKILRERTGNWGIFAQHETVQLDLRELMSQSVSRPIMMLFREPILFLLSLYGGFVYGLLYMCLSAIPLMFATKYGWHTGVVGLPYLSLFVGCFLTTCWCIYVSEPRYRKALKRTGLPVVPEERLTLMMLAAPIFTIGIFWMFWTGAYPKTAEHPNGCHFMVPIVGGAFFGFGFLGIFMPMINYVLDTYLMLAASGMAANTFLRSAMGAAFPLFATQMFKNLGIQWAGTLVGCLSAIMIPIPFLFYKFGPYLRSKSKFAFNLEDTMASKAKGEDDEEHGESVGAEFDASRQASRHTTHSTHHHQA